MNTGSDLALDDLRAERHRLAAEVARLAWLRRLVVARADLEVARLTGVAAVPNELCPTVRRALALDAAAGPEMLSALAEASRSLAKDVARTQELLDGATRELVDRYTVDPASCLAATRP